MGMATISKCIYTYTYVVGLFYILVKFQDTHTYIYVSVAGAGVDEGPAPRLYLPRGSIYTTIMEFRYQKTIPMMVLGA